MLEKTYPFTNGNEKKSEKTINKSIKLGRLGKVLKESVGDRDEMPIVLHNFALNILISVLITVFYYYLMV